MAPNRTNQIQDYDPDTSVQVNQHGKDIEEIKTRVDTLEDKYGQNEKLANTICEAAETQSKIKDMITGHLIFQIQQNPLVQDEMTKFINKADRKAVMTIIKKIGFGGWTIIVALLSGGLVFFLKK